MLLQSVSTLVTSAKFIIIDTYIGPEPRRASPDTECRKCNGSK